ncbi:T9SS type A sorting domain-containing protein [Aequorivita marina]|uniref:T9SS type A sorting domain-containing protein n=1 Tax=Aequorivita marina TaxID=3073654 RepID=UPI002876B063|nr:T9SS type A sorting domain-containing protein [Aequorivita sp. S2608]MDS1298258.1 T9SS type A sorting domain-containing protein [Aequorivita sp. S2608]
MLFSLFLCLGVFTLHSQERMAVVQQPKVMLLDVETGEIVDPNFISLGGGRAKGITQVEDEIWVTYQLADKIERYDLEGTFVGSITTGIDNIRGLAVVNDSEVWVTNWIGGNGAYSNAIIRFDFDGNNLGYFYTTPESTSPMDVIDTGEGEVYISYHETSNIERRDYDGNLLGTIVETGVVNFIQQIEIEEPGVILAAVFSDTPNNPPGIYRFSIADGSILGYWDGYDARGVAKLDNGDIVYTNFLDGVFRLNPDTGETSLIDPNEGQYFARIDFTLSTNDFNDSKFAYYPNPTNGKVFFEYAEAITEVSVTNVLGQNVINLRPEGSKAELDLSSFPTGVYIVNLKTKNGSKTVKIMKQ